LIKNNARVAAQIAVELEKQSNGVATVASGDESSSDAAQPTPVVIGGSILDVHYRVLDEHLEVSSFT
jgi:hypothetical protein